MRLTYGFLSVGEHVSLEHLLPLECLAAEVADEGEGVGVQVQVPLEVPLQREALRALGALVGVALGPARGATSLIISPRLDAARCAFSLATFASMRRTRRA